MYKPVLMAFAIGLGVCTSCSREPDPEPPPNKLVCPSILVPEIVPMPAQSFPRFLPGPDCGDRNPGPICGILPIDPRLQRCDLWCWSAAFSMLTEYAGAPKTECQIVSLETGYECCTLDPCGDPACNRSIKSEQVEPLLARLDIQARYRKRALTEKELRQELSNGRPVLIVWQDRVKKTDRHMALVAGSADGKYRIIDPNPTGGVGPMVSYGVLKRGYVGEWSWTESWTLRSNKVGACQAP